MAGFFGGRADGGADPPPKYTGMQLQTSAQQTPIPIVWGTNRMTVNLIDYFGFYSQSASKGKGLGKGGNYDYYANIILAICEGTTTTTDNTIGKFWEGSSQEDFTKSGYGLYPGDASQGANPWATAVAAGHDIGYAYTMYVAQGNTPLGQSASVPSLWFEVFSSYHGVNCIPGSYDANFGDIIPDLLCNTRFGLNFPKSRLIGTDNLREYHLAQNIAVSPILREQEQVTSIINRWAQIGDFWAFYDGQNIQVVPLGDTAISANGANYVPNLTPVYDVGPDDFVVADKNSNKATPPVKVVRKDPADGYNMVQLDCTIRGEDYNTVTYRWFDQSSIDVVGIQAPNVISCTEICNQATAQVVLPLIAQRALYIRNTYEFKLLPTFVLLLPGDLISLTEPNIGLNQLPVRIRTIDEDDKGNLSFVAEEFPGTLGAVYVPNTEPYGGGPPYNPAEAPPATNAPAFFQPDLSLTQGINQVWIAVSGGTNWGGCGIFVSFDEVNYTQIGEQETGSVQGTLTAALLEASGLDTTDVLSVDCTESLGVISPTATEADAEAFRTLILVDSELIAYGTVTPTGSYTANLTYLERGVYGTTPAAHSIGAPASIINETNMFVYNIPSSYFGETLYFEFPSVNAFQTQPQSLADCAPYSFTPAQPTVAPPTNLVLTLAAPPPESGTENTSTAINISWTLSTDQITEYQLAYSTNGGTTYSPYVILGNTTTSYSISNPTPNTYYTVEIRGVSIYAGLYSPFASQTIYTEITPPAALGTPVIVNPNYASGGGTSTFTCNAYGSSPLDFSYTGAQLYRGAHGTGFAHASAVGSATPPLIYTDLGAGPSGYSQVSYTEEGVPSGNWDYYITVTNATGTSGPSAPYNVTVS